ncbi:MAG: hypothetical protein HUU06_01405 [Planctomycetaceae bacterium]|nr:hypothetical protein [Planctomycetaceae bacterium]
MAFHTNDGLFFERLPDGSVEVTHRVPVVNLAAGQRDAERGGSPCGMFATVRRWVLGCAAPGKPGDCTWASVVASMSRPGETSDTYDGALRFHDGQAIKPPMGVAANLRLALASLEGYTGAGKDDPTIRDTLAYLRAAASAAGE